MTEGHTEMMVVATIKWQWVVVMGCLILKPEPLLLTIVISQNLPSTIPAGSTI